MCGIIIAGSILTWRLAILLRFADVLADPPHRAGTGRPPPGRTTDLVQPAVRIMAVAAVLALLTALAGFVPLAGYLLTSTLGSLMVICTAVFLYRSLTEPSDLLFLDRERTGSRYLQLLPPAFGFVLFLITLPAVLIIWGISPERIVDFILALKSEVAVGQIQLSSGSVMTFAIVCCCRQPS